MVKISDLVNKYDSDIDNLCVYTLNFVVDQNFKGKLNLTIVAKNWYVDESKNYYIDVSGIDGVFHSTLPRSNNGNGVDG